jgi:hypothetical protein
MYQGIRPYVTTGVALVGASVIAVSPISVSPPEVQAPPPLSAANRVVMMSDVQLASLADDIERFAKTVRVAPTLSGNGADQLLNVVGTKLNDATSARDVINAISFALTAAPGTVLGPYIMPIVANVPGMHVPGVGNTPGDITDYDFGDAAALTLADLLNEPIGLLTLGPAIVYLATDGSYSPSDIAGLLADAYLVNKPFTLAEPWVAALANALPESLGGGIDLSDPDSSGAIIRTFLAVRLASSEFVSDLFHPDQQMIQSKQEVGIEKVSENTWPPTAHRAFDTLQDVGEELREVPKEIVDEVAESVRAVRQYLHQGRPVDAIRYLVAHSIDLPARWAEIPLALNATFLPPRLADAANDTIEGAYQIGRNIADDIAPDPLKKVVEYKQFAPSGITAPQGNPGNYVPLSLPDPKKKVGNESGGNLIVSNGTVGKDGTPASQLDNMKPKPGSHARAVVKEVRKEIRQTIKDVRQGVRDVVKAVTGIGKKKPPKESPAE